MKKTILVSVIIVVLVLLVWYFRGSLGERIDFNSQVRPIINEKCMACHGGVKQQAGLSFLFLEEAFQELKSGRRAIVPGKLNKSELIDRIHSTDPDVFMPPSGDRLSDEEVKILEKWIQQGAHFDSHWAYKMPVERKSGSIDEFVGKHLKNEDLSFSEEADKSTLLRRISLDLTGLPPTLEQSAVFMNDSSPDAYENLVDRLLGSEHFGERWASMWLDLARYADSQGYQKDLLRKEIWRYRDWVIQAFNDDMPFNEFTVDQLAGDLVQNASSDQHLATAFHRNTMTNDEGGTDDEEYRVAAVIDRVNTTFEIWQGTTIACVQCHSHPYDPIRHEEFYELYAYFNNTADTDSSTDQPKKALFSPAQQTQQAKLKQAMSSVKDSLSPEYIALMEEYIAIMPGEVQVMSEMHKEDARVTRVFQRGNWLSHGDTVLAATPDFLPSSQFSPDRMGLAQWLVDGNNPLTARVIVNRFWEQLFGNGIVYTLEDFGTQGSKPSHPELLDYLALKFQGEHEWSVKKLLREIVLSRTYKQSSRVSETLYEKDRYNFHLARGPRYRLSAEGIRDQALSVSGLLNKELYGPSVMPHQPDGVWNVIRHVGSWDTPEDGNQHRRGIYTFWRRVSPYPSMMSFDVPSREICVSRRIRTNTPLQALITMNDPVFVEASQALASRMREEGGKGVEAQIKYGYKLAMMRDPDAKRLKTLMDLYQQAEESMDIVANVILNLDEVIMKS